MEIRIFGERTAKDLLSFERYLDPLSAILTNPDAETPFVVGIYGAWGSGKSTLLDLLEKRLCDEHSGSFVVVRFNPWVHRNETNLLVPLLHTLHDALAEDPWRRFADSAKKIWDVLARLGADLTLKALTVKQVSVEELEKLERRYLDERARVISEMRKLRKALQEEADTIAKGGAKLLLLIDDLDRCEPSDIINVLESIKLFLDLQHLFVVLAVDKEVIDRGIEVKYSKFSFAADRQAAIGAEYLEKMVQLPFHLFPVPVRQVGDFIHHLGVPPRLAKQVELLKRILPPSPRKIKRILNILAVTCEIAAATPGLKDLDLGVLCRLVVLQVGNGELYLEAVRKPEFLVALEELAAHKLDLGNPIGFDKFGSNATVVRDLCQRFYRPQELASLLDGLPFGSVQNQLALYTAMLGA